MTHREICTIGHSTHTINKLIGLLCENEIEMVADVRSTPYSRYNPQFNKENLIRELNTAKIEYSFFGNELGARVNDKSYYIDEQVQYDLLAKRKEFQDALMKISIKSEHKKIALMCSEKEPLDCHRTILVAHELTKIGEEIVHILPDGTLEYHNETLNRLVELQNGQSGNLFFDTAEQWENAISKQAKRIAYRMDCNLKFNKETKS